MPVSQLPGQRWFLWLRNPALRLGVMTGIYLSAVLAAWLVVANRVPWSAKFADIRNILAAALGALLMLIPIVRFLRNPARLFASGLAGWSVLTCTYWILGLFYERLYSRMTPFRVFILGAVVYGCGAVISWVAMLVLMARHQPMVATRRRTH